MHRDGEQRVAAPDHPVATAHAMPRPHDARRAPTGCSGGGDASKGDATNSRFIDESTGRRPRAAGGPRVTSRTGVTRQAEARALDRGAAVHHDVEPGGTRARRGVLVDDPELQPDRAGRRSAIAWSTTAPGQACCSRRRRRRRHGRPRRRASARPPRRGRSRRAGARARSRGRCDCRYRATPYAARDVLVDSPTTAQRPGVVRRRAITSGSLRCTIARTSHPLTCAAAERAPSSRASPAAA